MIRVRQLIPYLMIGLEKKDAYPKKVITQKYENVSYPSSIKKNNSYSEFGIQLEKFVLLRLQKIYKDKFLDVEDHDSSQDLDCLSEKDKIKYFEEILKYVDNIEIYFKKYYPYEKISKIVSHLELNVGNLVGHPDIIIFNTDNKIDILDVKVFYKLNGRGKDGKCIRLQLSLYAMLAREMGFECNKIGIVMPWKRDPVVEIFDISKWDSSKMLNISKETVNKVILTPEHRFKWCSLLNAYNVGTHIEKKELDLTYKNTPFQIFLYGNNPSNELEEKGRKSLVKDIYSDGIVYIHAPYNLNLAIDKDYVINACKNYLKDAEKVGAKGVVFHVGHCDDEDEGIEIMYKNLSEILSNNKVPFILETPCGNKNELLNTPTKFKFFIDKFKNKNLKVCVDTCHVFVSGFQLDEYINTLDTSSIKLFHFNGSRKEFNSKVDGHMHVTEIQNIPEEKLLYVLNYSKKYNIDILTE